MKNQHVIFISSATWASSSFPALRFGHGFRGLPSARGPRGPRGPRSPRGPQRRRSARLGGPGRAWQWDKFVDAGYLGSIVWKFQKGLGNRENIYI